MDSLVDGMYGVFPVSTRFLISTFLSVVVICCLAANLFRVLSSALSFCSWCSARGSEPQRCLSFSRSFCRISSMNEYLSMNWFTSNGSLPKRGSLPRRLVAKRLGAIGVEESLSRRL